MPGYSSRFLAVAMAIGLAMPVPASAQGFLSRIFGGGTDNANLRATIWVDPDGCEHWAIDDGIEGYMSQHLDAAGKPVCRAVATLPENCKSFDAAALFASGSSTIRSDALGPIEAYFSSLGGGTIIVAGHTDSVGSEEFNLQLSLERAEAVASVAQAFGVTAEARGFGEAEPVADNATAAGRAQNRRVDLHCS